MRRFFRLLFRALILLVVALVSALTAMRFAIHGREVAVPKFIGMTPGEADRVAAASGLMIQIDDRFYSVQVPAGRVLNQLPPPGETVRRGWRVRLAESLGPQRMAVPNVVGQSQRAAEINLARRGLQIGSVTTIHLPTAEPDTVLAQSPVADEEGMGSPKVNLVIAVNDPDAQALVTPDLVGRSLDDATRVIVGAGLRLGDVATVRSSVAPGAGEKTLPTLPIVAKQIPAAGQKIRPGATVNVQVVR